MNLSNMASSFPYFFAFSKPMIIDETTSIIPSNDKEPNPSKLVVSFFHYLI